MAPRVPTLNDPAAEARFLDEGFVVVPWLGEAALADLVALAGEIHEHRPEDSSWACDFYTDDRATKERVGTVIADAFADPIGRHFADHHSYLHAFVVNWPGEDGGLALHQHSSVVDEPDFRSAVVWCALGDLDDTTGTLHVVPRSHRVKAAPRPERSPGWFVGREQELMDAHGIPVHLRAGEALVFDNAMLHWSDVNRGDRPRQTAVATVAPRSTDLRYYSAADDGRVEVYRLEPGFFLDAVSQDFEWARPEGLELIEVRPADDRVPTHDEVARVLTSATARR